MRINWDAKTLIKDVDQADNPIIRRRAQKNKQQLDVPAKKEDLTATATGSLESSAKVKEDADLNKIASEPIVNNNVDITREYSIIES